MPNYLLLIAFASTLGAACGSDDDNSAADANPTAEMSVIRYSNVTLPDLGSDYVYEGWLIVDDAPVSAGRFIVDDTGVMTPAQFSALSEQADKATAFVLTIEPKEGDGPGPASTHILAGGITAGSSSLVTDHPAALGTSFSDGVASGSYILTAPTTGDGTLQEHGIWWLSPGTPMTAGLVLPELPEGWVYEGWVVDTAGPVSTGRFTDVADRDSDGAGPTKGATGDGPAFPGQDFITPAKVLNDGSFTAVISVEPEPDNGAAPFLIKPLVHMPIGTNVAPDVHVMVNNAAATLPAATIQIAAE